VRPRVLASAKALLVIAALLLPFYASAATIVCSGTVMSLSYHANVTGGTSVLYVRLSAMNSVCSPDALWTVSGTPYVTTAEGCKARYATLLAARISGLPFSSIWFDGDAVPAACNAWSNWAQANIRYQML
jgi:hypothetical protein